MAEDYIGYAFQISIVTMVSSTYMNMTVGPSGEIYMSTATERAVAKIMCTPT